jgi:hypothetical protein
VVVNGVIHPLRRYSKGVALSKLLVYAARAE